MSTIAFIMGWGSALFLGVTLFCFLFGLFLLADFVIHDGHYRTRSGAIVAWKRPARTEEEDNHVHGSVALFAFVVSFFSFLQVAAEQVHGLTVLGTIGIAVCAMVLTLIVFFVAVHAVGIFLRFWYITPSFFHPPEPEGSHDLVVTSVMLASGVAGVLFILYQLYV